MTSMPASRSARAMIFAPRSCPSRPGLATTTRIFWVVLEAGIAGGPGFYARPGRNDGGPRRAQRSPRASVRRSADAQTQAHPRMDVADDRVPPGAREAAGDRARAADARDRAALRPGRDADVVGQAAGPAEADGVAALDAQRAGAEPVLRADADGLRRGKGRDGDRGAQGDDGHDGGDETLAHAG